MHAVSVLEGDLGLTGDEAFGVRVVAKAVDEPLRWIAENGGVNGYVVVSKVREGKVGEGYNAATGEYGDLVAQGILDPVKVTRSALVNAASIAGMLLTTETLVVDKPEDEDDAPAGGTATATATVTDRRSTPQHDERRPGLPGGVRASGDSAGSPSAAAPVHCLADFPRDVHRGAPVSRHRPA